MVKFIKIIFISILMGLFFKYLLLFFENQLGYEYNLKFLYLIFVVFLTFSFYLILSLVFKAFKYEDIKLKY